MHETRKSLIPPILWLFMGTMILANIAGSMYRPLLPLYLQNLGAGVEQVGLYFTLGAVAPLLFQIFGGWLSDHIGRLEAIAIGSMGGVLGYMVFIVAPSWQWLLIATIGNAMAFSFVGPSFQAFIAELSTEETRGRVYGLSEMMFSVVGIIGPPIGAYLAQDISFKMMFLVAGGMYGTAAVIRILMARHARRQATTPREAPSLGALKTSLLSMVGMLAAGGVITWIFVSDGIRDTAFGMTQQLMPLYLENLMGINLVQIGWLTSISGVATMVVLSLSGWVSDRFGERVGIVGGFAVIAAGWTLFLVSGSFMAFAVAWAIIGAGSGLMIPAYDALISKAVPEKMRGVAFGLFSTSVGIISLPAPWIGARLWEAFTPLTPFLVPLAAMLIMMPIMWVKFRLPAVPLEGVGEPVPAAD